MTRKRDLTNQKFGRITVTKEAGKNQKGKLLWEGMCECGTVKTYTGSNLKSGTTKSCGCAHKDIVAVTNFRHGLTETRAYGAWCNIKSRCYNPSTKSYRYYGALGIKVCDRWLNSFENFYEDMGEPERGDSIERIDNKGDYEPSNCKWSNATEQGRNKSNNHLMTYQGETLCMSEWAERLGLKTKSLHARIVKGWSVEKALTTPGISKCQTI